MNKLTSIDKVDISLKQLIDIDTQNGDYDRVDNIRNGQFLTAYVSKERTDQFRFRYLTDFLVAGTGITFSTSNGVTTISATGGGGGASGLPYAVASGTNTYTATISGVTSYTAGDAYIISFTNGNDDDSTININSLGVKTLVKQFDVQLTGGDIVSGQELIIMYDGTNFQTLEVAPNQLFAYVTNADSVTINKGQPVYAFGASGNRMSVKLAYNTTDATSAQTVGVVYSTSIAVGQKGFIITQGVISGLNTAAYSAGAQLYLGSTAGALTATKPSAPNHLVYIGIVERSNAGNGQIYIKPQNGYEMNELHDVASTGAVNNDILYRDTTVTPNLWKPASIPTILGYTPVPTTRSISTTSPLTGGGDLSADRTISIPAATSLVNGYLSSTDWTNFNTAYTNRITSLTTTGTSGAATLIANTLNIPNYGVGTDTFTLRFTIANVAPADNQNYILADITPNLNTTGTLYKVTFPFACKLVGAGINVINLVSNATTEASTFNFRLNNSTDTLLSNAVVMSGAANTFNVYNITGLSTNIAANDTAQIKWTTPVWATNPSAAYIVVHCYFERT